MTITTTFVTVWRRFEYLAEKVIYSDHYKLHRTKCSASLKNVISPALLEEDVNELGTSGYSLILDESTDIATHKYMAVCIKFYSQKHCTMRTDHLGMFEVARTTSQDLYEGLNSFLNANKIDVTKMIADGASNMVGAHNSLFTL
jgi:CRISPR/Cas system-associated protein Csm6